MNLHKLFFHDVRCGLFRFRYLAAIVIFVLPCIQFASLLDGTGLTGTWIDYLLYCFKGMEPIRNVSTAMQVRLPMMWLLVMEGGLIINLDYLLNDLSQIGQQIICRSWSRRNWFLSKCLWNICSCLLYFFLAGAAVAGCLLVSKGTFSFHNTPKITAEIFMLSAPITIQVWQGLIAVVLLPLSTITALSMLQMALCLFLKPILCFVICTSLLVVSAYVDSALVLGNGAMAMRSSLVVPNGLDWRTALFLNGIVILGSALMGMWKFNRTDILGRED